MYKSDWRTDKNWKLSQSASLQVKLRQVLVLAFFKTLKKWHIVYIPNPSKLTYCLRLTSFVRLSCCWKGGHVMCGRLLFSAHQASRSATGCKLWGGAGPASVRARPRICRIFPHTHYPPAHQSHPPQILPKHRPPQAMHKANQPKICGQWIFWQWQLLKHCS